MEEAVFQAAAGALLPQVFQLPAENSSALPQDQHPAAERFGFRQKVSG